MSGRILVASVLFAMMVCSVSFGQVFTTVCENGVCRVVELESPVFQHQTQTTTIASLGKQCGTLSGMCSEATIASEPYVVVRQRVIRSRPVWRVFRRQPVRVAFGSCCR